MCISTSTTRTAKWQGWSQTWEVPASQVWLQKGTSTIGWFIPRFKRGRKHCVGFHHFFININIASSKLAEIHHWQLVVEHFPWKATGFRSKACLSCLMPEGCTRYVPSPDDIKAENIAFQLLLLAKGDRWFPVGDFKYGQLMTHVV